MKEKRYPCNKHIIYDCVICGNLSDVYRRMLEINSISGVALEKYGRVEDKQDLEEALDKITKLVNEPL